MSAESFENVVSALLDNQPFRVFTIELNGGKRFEVDHPRTFTMRDGTAHFIAPGGMPIWFDYNSVNHIFPSTADTPTGSQPQ